MKTFVCVLFIAAVAVAEPPRYRFARFRSERQELAEGNEKEPATKSGEAPYAAAGFKPNKEFNLPSRQELLPPATSYGTPDDSYGAPFKTYSAPQVKYGVPEARDKEGDDSDEKKGKSEEGSAGEAESFREGKKEKKEKLEEAPKEGSDIVSAQGAYYVLLPGTQLQRVQFQTENDIRNMAYTARLQYRNEDRAPLFVYTAAPQSQSAAYVQLV